MTNTLLLEIGTEEIPARFFKGALDQLKSQALAKLAEARLAHGTVKVMATPRRLVLLVEAVAERQEDLETVSRGPAKRAAFDAEGKPTRAAEGFARGQGVSVDALFVEADDKGVEYVYARRHEVGKSATEVLPRLLEELILGLEWPKSMRWADRSLRFARPIHWLIALYGSELLPVAIDGIEAGRTTRGHRDLGPAEPILIEQPEELEAALEQAFVILDHNRRREIIWTQIMAEQAKLGGYIPKDEELLEEVTHLVEWPTAFTGSFDEAYLAIPPQVLVTSMREHQRYFPVYGEKDGSGALLPNFVAVRNGNREYLDNVRAGNEKVLAARLADARFFFEEDQSRTLESRLPQLETIVFQEKLGTLRAKVDRVMALTAVIGQAMELSEQEQAAAARAALLAKADLVTLMVGEFPELQGVMGKEYALIEGEDPAVAEAIFEHYLPRGANDDLPQSAAGITVALADKLDTLAGFFSVGMIPTGSADPFALRRAATGVTTILVDSGLHLALEPLCSAALAAYAASSDALAELLHFFEARLRVLLQERGIRYDVIDAVIAADTATPADAVLRAEALQAALDDPSFGDVFGAFRRVVNLAAKGEPDAFIQSHLFTEPAETALYEALLALQTPVDDARQSRNYPLFYQLATQFKAPVDKFLDEIMVMVDDEAIRRNRLALLSSVASLLGGPADLSKLVI